ncbi:glycoside hydrolase family 70 protein, partial [uncultured Lactobacillus sp.]|uniref:glycoside hydrolase family 70 protein n=1 Tax=uncultured Lactobacillus sp. TaxID=153152 RepID=UPI0025E1F4CB
MNSRKKMMNEPSSEKQRWSLRKLSVGMTSMLLGTTMFWASGAVSQVKADTTTASEQAAQTQTNTAKKAAGTESTEQTEDNNANVDAGKTAETRAATDKGSQETTTESTTASSSAQNQGQAATATSSTTTKAASSILSKADSKTANSNTSRAVTAISSDSRAVTATSSATTKAVSSAANKKPITGLRHYSNNKLKYYGKNHVQYRNRYASQGNKWYYFDSNGYAVTGLRHYGHNKLEYYGKDHVQYRNRYASLRNKWYYFGSNGDAVTGLRYYGHNKLEYYGKDHVQYRKRYASQGHKWYYFGSNGDAVTGLRHYGHNKLEYYGADHVQYRNRYYQEGNKFYYFGGNGDARVAIRGAIENDKLNIYDMRTNKLIKSLDVGTWENLAYSMDANSINNVDGYLSYSGWYRPIGTSQDGKTWHKTGAGDWRPILMYVWPNKDVQAQFIKYFVNHGYENANYGLTKVSVANLNKDTDATVLNTAAQNLRYVIEKSIATNKGTGKLANDINGFAATVPELSASSELSVQSVPNYKPNESGTVDNDQVIFVNDDSKDQRRGNTSYADSKYRLMNRTINNETGNDNSDNSPELLVGNDIDNSNPVVQAENLNWEYFLLNYGKLMGYNRDGNFDGFRVDAADNINADVFDQMGQLMNDMYHMKGNPQNANNHLSYNEGYHSGAAWMLNKKGNPQLYMDSGEFYTLRNVLGRANNRDNISNLATNSIVNRQNDVTENEATPNWSFVTNHDQRKNLINRLIIKDHPGIAYIMGSAYKAEYANQAWQEFYADQKKTDKQYAQYNVPAQYAILLSNKDTVPQIYYGDLYNETAQYMQEKSIYYDAITTLMKARKQFVSGGQT